MRRLLQIVLPFWLAIAVAPDAFAAERVALVIGNGTYTAAGILPNPVDDARAIAESFKRMGFAVLHRENLDLAGMRAALQEFEEAAVGSEVATVFFGGHGIQMDGEHYLVPVDARLLRESDIEDEAVPLRRLLSAMQPATRLRLVLLDASRTSPFPAQMQISGRRSISPALARLELGSNTLIGFAARDGATADDRTAGHSPYTAALLNSLEEPGLDIRLLLSRVRDDVVALTGGAQEPHFYSVLGGAEVFLVDPGQR